MLRVQLDGSHINVQIETETQAEDHRTFYQSRFDIRMPNGAQQYRIERPPLVDDRIRHEFFGFEVVLAAIRVIDEIELQSLQLSNGFENLQTFACHFGADAVAREKTHVV